jgi:hypothetical protein
MIGKELNQLMTGVDFGGVQIQGTTFEVTGGWDALPWFTDNWDSVETSADYYVVCDGSTGTIRLPYVPAAGQKINIYIKRKNTNTTVRIDDEFYSQLQDSSTGTNPNAEMPTFIGDGSNDVVEIGEYIGTEDGDVLIFRPIESDGAVTITDENLLDTRLSGGSLSSISGSYVTATGLTAEEISITGGKFIEPDHVPAPEENVPGQVLESLSIKVFQSSVSKSAALQSKITIANGTDTIYEIGQTILENKSVFVYVDNVGKIHDVDFTVDIENYNVIFTTAPAALSKVEIISIGIGGVGILDYQNYVADGETNLFLTNANYEYTSNVFVTKNGVRVDVGFKNSSGIIDVENRTLIEFGIKPAAGDIIKIVCLESSSDVDSLGLAIVQVNTQTFYFEGSTRSFDLDGFTNLVRGNAASSMIVQVNGKVLKGPDTIYDVYDGTNNVFILGLDPLEAGGSILPSNISVYINGDPAAFITDYVFDGPTKTLTIDTGSLTVGDVIKIENDLRVEYTVVNNNVVIDSAVDMGFTGDSTSSKIDVTWFAEYPSLDIIADQKSGGKVQYQLSRTPLSASYVWVFKNDQRLIQEKDFYVSLPRSVVYLNVPTTSADTIKTFTFSRNVFHLPIAYEIHKDMLNVYHYNRYSKGEVKLVKPLNYYDTSIEVNDATNLSTPISTRNLAGVVLINGERIEYMTKNGNILGQLRRGAQGTSIGEQYVVDTDVVDVGYQEVIPYNEVQERTDFVSDGSTLLIGPLDYVPVKADKSRWQTREFYVNKGQWLARNTQNHPVFYNPRDLVLYQGSYYTNIQRCAEVVPTNTAYWSIISIPDDYGPCDHIEVFAAGRRLHKNPQVVWSEINGPDSPNSDITQEAEFSVDGATAFIRLTEPMPAGTRITVIKRKGNTWYDRGLTTATTGIALTENETAIAKFISKKTTSLPE